MPRSIAEERLLDALMNEPLPGWDLTTQYPFDKERRWTFDFAFPSQKLAVECEGSYHRTHKGHRKDCEKFTEAARQGWRVMRFYSTNHARAAEWAALIREALCCPPKAPDRRASSG